MRNSFIVLGAMLMLVACNSSQQEHPNPSQSVSSYEVSVDDAKMIASSILPNKDWQLINVADDPTPYYIFNASDGGFVIVSAYEAVEPILGYSEVNSIDPSNIPLGLREMLGSYAREIDMTRKMVQVPSISRVQQRAALLRDNKSPSVVVEPLLGEIRWNQNRGYDTFTPDFTPVGCVATATAMIMRYWEYPERGKGVYQYRSGRFGIQGHNYNYTLKWDKMPLNNEALKKLDPHNQKEATFHTSRFSYGVAVALDMNFDYGENGGSGTYQKYVPKILRKFYNYPPTIKNLYAANYSQDEWERILRDELEAHRPVQYAGRGEGGGHSFVIDGYQDNGMYSINWGWGGLSNGWFRLSSLSPSNLGEGGGTGGFNMDHEMIVGFEPPARVQGEERDNVESLDPAYYDQPVVIPSIDLFIKYTKFNDVETHSTAGRYEIYTEKVIIAKDGLLNTIITPKFLRADAKGYILLSLDLNHNGSFNAKEDKDLIISFKELKSGESVKETINLMSYDVKPKKGERYKMRVNISAYGYSNPNYMISGEVEDYTVIIK